MLCGILPPVSIGLITVAYGPAYRRFLPRWGEAVSRLNTPPDQITVVTDNPVDVLDHLNVVNMPIAVIRARGEHKHHPQVYANQAVEDTDTDWICKMDVDDVIKPHAFDRLHNTPCDVWMFGISYQGRELHPPAINAQTILASPHNLVFSGSPYRKWLSQGAKYRDMIYEDWMFWIDCAKQNARFCHSGTIDYEYVMHGGNISTRSDDAYWQAVVRSLR